MAQMLLTHVRYNITTRYNITIRCGSDTLVGLRTVLEDIRINFTPSADTYYINDFNAKVQAVVLIVRSDSNKRLKAILPGNYTLITFNIFYWLGILGNNLQKTTRNNSTLPYGTYKTSLDTPLSLKSLLLHYKQINRVAN